MRFREFLEIAMSPKSYFDKNIPLNAFDYHNKNIGQKAYVAKIKITDGTNEKEIQVDFMAYGQLDAEEVADNEAKEIEARYKRAMGPEVQAQVIDIVPEK